MIISIKASKTLGKVWHLFIIESQNKLEIGRTDLNTIEAVYDKPVVSIILNEEEIRLFVCNLKGDTHFFYSYSIQHTKA